MITTIMPMQPVFAGFTQMFTTTATTHLIIPTFTGTTTILTVGEPAFTWVTTGGTPAIRACILVMDGDTQVMDGVIQDGTIHIMVMDTGRHTVTGVDITMVTTVDTGMDIMTDRAIITTATITTHTTTDIAIADWAAAQEMAEIVAGPLQLLVNVLNVPSAVVR